MVKKVKRETKGKQEAPKFLAKVPEEHVFWCHDGKVLTNMKELGDALSVMTDETYSHHWNAERKDFSNWVRDVIGDTELAKDLAEAASQSIAASQVTIRIASLTKQ